MLKKILIFTLFFVIIYKPEFIFIPFGINKFFGSCGLLLFLFDKDTRDGIACQSRISIFPFLKLLLPCLIISILSILLNGSSDFYFPRYCISIILAFYSAYLLAWLVFKTYKEITFPILTTYFIIATLVSVLIALIFYFEPSLMYEVNKYQRLDEIAISTIDRVVGTRLIGIGANFFTAALINGTLLIIMSAYFIVEKHTTITKLLLLAVFAIISALGLMVARTIIFAIAIGGCVIIYQISKSSAWSLKLTISIAILFLLIIIVNASILFNEEIEKLFSFGFEMFINFSNNGNLESHSMQNLYRMWGTVPTELKTWIIGDGRWEGDNGGYYMGVDLGYLRDIYYFGIIGSICLFAYYYKTIRLIFVDNLIAKPFHKVLAISLFLFVLATNAKGPCDLFFYIIPYYFCSTKSN